MKKIIVSYFLLLIGISFAQTIPKYTIKRLKNNSKRADFGPAFHTDEKVVFSSKRGKRNRNPNFLYLYQGTIDPISGDLIDLEKINTNVKGCKSSVSFTPDGSQVYFTKTNRQKGDTTSIVKIRNNKHTKHSKRNKKRRKVKFVNFSIYRVNVGYDGFWRGEQAVSLPFNSKDYMVAHPALNKDGTKLYFVSNMPGTYGESDIFVVNIHKDGTYSKPQNLGNKINTSGRELFPFIDENDILYFASDGRHEGFGGLDIYAVKVNEDNTYSKVLHLEAPINTKSDDFGFIINNKNKGYFSSNRIGNDDLYYLEANCKLQINHTQKVIAKNQQDDMINDCKQQVTIQLKNRKTSKAVSLAIITIYDNTDTILVSEKSSKEGTLTLELSCNQVYKIKVSKKNYDDYDIHFLANDGRYPQKIPIKLTLSPDFNEIKIAKERILVNVESIYFPMNSSKITPTAMAQLSKVVSLMFKYPKLIIEAGSHTDSRGNTDSNLKLSNERAIATVNYIVNQGITPNRITAKGYGETKPVNECRDGIKCTNAQHQLNRRTEFVILNPEVLNYSIKALSKLVLSKKIKLKEKNINIDKSHI